MADTLNQTLVTQFTNMVNHVAQQKESFFRGRVLTKPVKGKKFDWQNLASGAARLQTSRHEQVIASSPEHSRRGAIMQTYYDAWLFDQSDDLQSLIELGSPYVQALAAEMARTFDKVVAQAALGTTLIGESLSSSTTFAAEGGVTVDATAGVTYAKLRELQAAFHKKGVGLTADEKISLYITEQEHQAMLGLTELISRDYSSDFVVMNGRVQKVLNMDVVLFPSAPSAGETILNVASTTRNCFAAANTGIAVGINSDIAISVAPREDLVDSKQVKALFRLAGLRTEAAKVVQFNTTAS